MEQLGALGALAEAFDLDDDTLGDGPPQTVGAWTDWILRAHAAGPGRIAVRTSGSTGSPRLCIHAVADLLEEAAFLATRFADRRRVVALVPADHLYGLVWTALLPDALGVPVVVRTVGAPLSLEAGDLVVAVPDQWRALSRMTRRWPGDVVGVSSAGPLDDTVAAVLLAAGLAGLVDIYGASETGGIAIRALPALDYDLLPRWQLTAADPDDWRLVDCDGRHHDLPDHVARLGERVIRPVGRRDGAVQVAGHNVWPGRVAGVLRTVEGVADVAVRLHGNGRLKAFVVPHPGQDPARLSARIEQLAANRLTDPERPKAYRFGTAVPRTAMGKLEDWG
nr:AMP-binding protein [Sphingomonas sp. CFBP 13733]